MDPRASNYLYSRGKFQQKEIIDKKIKIVQSNRGGKIATQPWANNCLLCNRFK